MARRRTQTIKVKDYGDEWLNRLAVIGDRFEAMECDRERAAALRFFLAKYLDVCAVPTPEQIKQMETGLGVYTPRMALELGMKTAIGNVKRALAASNITETDRPEE